MTTDTREKGLERPIVADRAAAGRIADASANGDREFALDRAQLRVFTEAVGIRSGRAGRRTSLRGGPKMPRPGRSDADPGLQPDPGRVGRTLQPDTDPTAPDCAIVGHSPSTGGPVGQVLDKTHVDPGREASRPPFVA